MNNKLKEIKNLIEKSEIPQKELAKGIGVNHIHLNSVLKERNSLSERLYVRLKYY